MKSIIQTFAFGIMASLASGVASAQQAQNYVFGRVGGSYIGPILQTNDGAALLGGGIGYGRQWDNWAVEGQVGYFVPSFSGEAADGALIVPSVTGKYIFGNPGDKTRFSLGGGLDYVVLTGEYLGAVGLPWAHAVAGLDMELNPNASAYLEARTYALATTASVGMRFKF